MKTNTPTQKQIVRLHLEQHGTITPLFALQEFGCYRLGAVIHKLRNEGMNITTTTAKGRSRVTGRPVMFAEYHFKTIGNKKAKDAAVGDYYFSDGSFADKDAALTDAQKAACIGIVFALANENDKSDYTATGIKEKTCHGYVVALKDAKGDAYCMWGMHDTTLGNYPTDAKGNSVDNYDYFTDNTTKGAWTDWNGYLYTQNMKTAAGTSWGQTDVEAGYPAAYHAMNYEPTAPSTSSGWFLPSIGQLWQVYQQRELLSNAVTTLGDTYAAALQNIRYWSSSEYYVNPTYVALYVYVSYGNVSVCSKGGDYCIVRSVLAF